MPTTSVFSLFNNTEDDSSSGTAGNLGPPLPDSESFATISRSAVVERQYSVYNSFTSKASEGAAMEKKLFEAYSEKAVQTEDQEIETVIDKSSQQPANPVDPFADYLIYGELDSKFLDTNQASFIGRIFHMDMLFPFELTTLDYLRRLFSCLVSGIRYPVVSVSVCFQYIPPSPFSNK